MSLQPAPVTFEHLTHGLGIGVATPRLSWKLPPGTGAQQAYEVELHQGGRLRRTGRVDSPDHVLVPWPGVPLTSRERAAVRVRTWCVDGEPSALVQLDLVGLLGACPGRQFP